VFTPFLAVSGQPVFAGARDNALPERRFLTQRFHLFLRGELSNHIHQRLVRFAILLVEARDFVAEILAGELCVLVDCAGEEAFAQRTEWDESDSKFFQGRQDLRFRLSPPERVFALRVTISYIRK